MTKQSIAPGPFLVPMPIVLIGSKVEDRPNFMTAAFCSIVNFKPATLACGLSPTHRTCRGIVETGAFSVNLPVVDQVELVDHCGLVSGDRTDKSALFETFTGASGAPMISSCPVTAECKLIHTFPMKMDTLFVGEVLSVHADDRVLTDGAIDWNKLQPLLFTFPDKSYWRLGGRVATAWDVGKHYKR